MATWCVHYLIIPVGTSPKLQVTSHKSQVTSHKSWPQTSNRSKVWKFTLWRDCSLSKLVE
ncbi:hypothetical protein BKA80DRAFT_284384, partial [Phyllosticta citrichinensis]